MGEGRPAPCLVATGRPTLEKTTVVRIHPAWATFSFLGMRDGWTKLGLFALYLVLGT